MNRKPAFSFEVRRAMARIEEQRARERARLFAARANQPKPTDTRSKPQ